MVKNLLANVGDVREAGSIPRSGRSTGGGHGNPLQYSCLENPMDRGAWRATVLGVAKSRTQVKQLSMHAWPLLKPQHRPPGTVLGGSLLFWLLIPLENSREL